MYCLCEGCGAEINYLSRKCPKCGRTLKEHMYRTGNPVDDNAYLESKRIHDMEVNRIKTRRKYYLYYVAAFLIPILLLAITGINMSQEVLTIICLFNCIAVSIYLFGVKKIKITDLTDFSQWGLPSKHAKTYDYWINEINDEKKGYDFSIYVKGVVTSVSFPGGEPLSYRDEKNPNLCREVVYTVDFSYNGQNYYNVECTVPESKVFLDSIWQVGDEIAVGLDRNNMRRVRVA